MAKASDKMNVEASSSEKDFKSQAHTAEAEEQTKSMEVRKEILSSAAMPAKKHGLCCVHGCEKQCWPPERNGCNFRWSSFSRDSRHCSEGKAKKLMHYAIKGLCTMHYKRLKRAKDANKDSRPCRSRSPSTLQLALWTPAELMSDAARQCSVQVHENP